MPVKANTEIFGYVSQYMAGTSTSTSDEIPRKLAEIVKQGNLPLVGLVEQLGDYLTDEASATRSRSLGLLSDVLSKLDSKQLNERDLKVLVTFYTAKLSDSECLYPVLNGMKALVTMDSFPEPMLKLLVSGLTDKYSSNEQRVNTRSLALKLLDSILSRFQTQLIRDLNNPFISAFINIASGERDPRNLVISFELSRKIAQNFNLSDEELSRQLFDCIFCYFPITFRSVGEKETQITGDQLRHALRQCLAASPVFAPYTFPSLVEKLTAASPTVRLDALEAMLMCIKQYGVTTVSGFRLSLWNTLKYIVLDSPAPPPNGKELSPDDVSGLIGLYKSADSAALKCVAVTCEIFEALASQYTDIDDTATRDFFVLVYDSLACTGGPLATEEEKATKKEDKEVTTTSEKSVTSHIRSDKPVISMDSIKKPTETSLRKSCQAILILAVMCRGSVNVYNTLVPKVMHSVLEPASGPRASWLSEDTLHTVLTQVSFMLDTYQDLVTKSKTHDPANYMLKFKDDILMLVCRGLQTFGALCIQSSRLAVKLFHLPNFLDPATDWDLLVRTLTDSLVASKDSTAGDQAVFESLVIALSAISRSNPGIILQTTVSRLDILLPETEEEWEKSQKTHKDNCLTPSAILHVLLKLSVSEQVRSAVSVRLLGKLQIVSTSVNSVEYARLLLCTLSRLLQTITYKDSTDDFVRRLLPELLELTVSKISEDEHSCIYHDSLAIFYVSRMIQQITGCSPISIHEGLLYEAFRCLLVSNKIGNLEKRKAPTTFLKQPINVLEQKYSILLPLLCGFCSAVSYSKAKLPCEPSILVNALIMALEENQLELSERHSILVLLTITINKWFGSKEDSTLVGILDKMINGIDKDTKMETTYLEIFAWVTKALMLKADKLEGKCIEYVMGILNSSKAVSKLVPQCLEIMMTDSEYLEPFKRPGAFFDKMVTINVRIHPLYKQRFVEQVLPRLIDSFNSSTEDAQMKYLASIAVVIRFAGHDILGPHLKSIVPVLAAALSQKSSLILTPALSMLKTATEELPQQIERILPILIPRLLQILTLEGFDGDSKVKKLDLQCLTLLTRFPGSVLQKYQDDILLGTEEALDDDRRSVRELACSCRQKYFEVGL